MSKITVRHQFTATTGLAKAIDVDDGGHVYVAGHSDLPEGGSVFLTIKYDTNGDTLWTSKFRLKDPSWRAEANKLAVTEDGGVLVVGTVFNGNTYDFLTVKYASNGKMEWNKKYDGLNGDDKALSLIAVGKDAYVSGITGTGPTKTYTVVKYTSTTVKDSAIVDTNGVPQCMDGELIVKFRRPFVNTAWINKKGLEFGSLYEAVDNSLADRVAHKLGISSGGKIPVYKVFREMTTADSISISRLGEEVPMPEFWRILKIGVPAGTNLLAAIDSLNTMGNEIAYAQVNNIFQPYNIPDDPILLTLHRQPNLVPTAEYPNADINADPAWNIQTGIPEVKVGIVDDLIGGNQVDFGSGTESHIAGGHDYTLNGWFDWTNDVLPVTAHGSAVAGIIGAVRNNGIGIAGIAGGTGAAHTGCSLYSVGIVNTSGSYMSLDEIAPAITDASTDIVGAESYIPGCQILNASWGAGPSVYGFGPALLETVINAYHNQCVFVAGRGQAGSPGPYSSTWPSCYGGVFLDENGVLSVGASGTDGLSMTYANGDYYTQYGNAMDLVAPGTAMLVSSTVGQIPTNYSNCSPGLPTGYDCFRGTSAAAPHVAGVAALMMSEHNVLNGAVNDLAPEDVEHIMENTATDDVNGPLTYDEPNGWGRLNAGEAVRQVAPPYEVFHPLPIHPTFMTYPSQTILLNNYFDNTWGLPFGEYTATPTKVTFQYANTFGSQYTILNTWNRESSSLGLAYGTYLDGRYGASYTYDIIPSTGTVNATAETYCWHVTSNAAGDPLDQWIPAPPDQLKTAFSIHLLGPGGEVGVGEQPIVSGFSAYPSPTSDRINVSLPETLQANATLDVLDITGRIVMHQNLSRGIKTVQLTVENWADGVYCLRLDTGSKLLNTRFVKH